MNITIYSKKVVKKFVISANNEYLKRLSKYCKIKVVTINDYEKLKSKIDDKIYKININNIEETISSEDLASHFSNLAVTSNSSIAIVVNDDMNCLKYDTTLTISKMDIDEELLLTILLEQIYRSFRINNNEPYHK